MAKYLVTGAGGFVASHMIELLLNEGHIVIGSVRWNESLERMKLYENNPNFIKEYVELTDLSSLIRAINKHRPDVISHLAAQSWVPYGQDNPIYTMKNNIESTLNILEAVRIIQDIGLQEVASGYPDTTIEDVRKTTSIYDPLIHICSSSEFYGKVDRKDLPITEKHPANPGNVYGTSKVSGDFLAQIYSKYYDLNILITRMFTHTGPGRTMSSAECYYAKWIAEQEKISPAPTQHICKIGNMKSIRTWRDVRDAVTDYYKLFKQQKTGIYNISGDTQKSIQEVLDYLISISKLNKENINFETDPNLLRKVDVDVQTTDINKFKSEIEQSTNYTFEQTMQDLLDFWRKNV